MNPKDEMKTASETHHEHFHFKMMPFGLINASATLLCVINFIFALYLTKFV